jgi:Phage integrase family
VAIPVSDALATAIEAGPVGDMTFITGPSGKSVKKESFGTIFREWCDAAGVSKAAHGIRKAAATADAQDGYSDAELDAKFGWTGRKMAAHYTRTVSRERLSIAAAARVKSRT